jgi:hypothetical protein
MRVLEAMHCNDRTLKQLQDYVADFSDTGANYIELETSRIYSFRELIGEAMIKLLISRYYGEFAVRLQTCGDKVRERVPVFFEFCKEFECRKLWVPIRGPSGLSCDFYLTGGSYRGNSPFLFGTPSQFRNGDKRRSN